MQDSYNSKFMKVDEPKRDRQEKVGSSSKYFI